MTELITSTELCKRLSISKPTEWRWRQEGILPPPVKLGGRNYYPTSTVDEVYEQHAASQK